MMCVVPKTNLLPFDNELPNRDELLNVKLMQKRLAELLNLEINSCEIRRAKYQVNSNLRVLYSILTDKKEQLISARIYAKNPEKIDFHIFPNDRKMKNLGVLEQKFNSRVVAYAPEKCATAACFDKSGEVFGYAKVYAEKEWQTGRKVCQFLREQSQKYFPKLLGLSEENQMLLLEAVTGKRLAEVDKARMTKGFHHFGRAIAKLHNLSTEVELDKFLRLSPDRIRFALKTISLARPDSLKKAEILAEELLKSFAFAAEEKVILHGDVHPKNAILNGETLKLIDFDQLSNGNAAADIGSFLAGLRYKEIIGEISANERQKSAKAFLQGYAEIRDLPNLESLNWHTATALFTERAWRSITRIRPKGLVHFPDILEISRKILQGGAK